MNIKHNALPLMLLFSSSVACAEGTDRYVGLQKINMHQAVVVAEGDREPRSIGSYSVRLYEVDTPEFLTDHYVAGLIRPRDGTIREVTLADIGDRAPDLIVVIASVGTGGYISADAFSIGTRSVRQVAHVEGLPPAADITGALRKSRMTDD